MRTAGKPPQNRERSIDILWFADHFVVENNDGISTENYRLGKSGSDIEGFAPGVFGGDVARISNRDFKYCRCSDFEDKAGFRQKIAPSRRAGGENELRPRSRIYGVADGVTAAPGAVAGFVAASGAGAAPFAPLKISGMLVSL